MMKQHDAVWEETHVIHSYEVDMRGVLYPHVLFQFMLNSAWKHVHNTDFDYASLAERGQFWALSRFHFEVFTYPKWNDRVHVSTWGKAIERLYAIRDFSVHGDNGEKIAAATSYWLILQTETYRPQKMDRLKKDFPFHYGTHSLNMHLDKLPPLESGTEQSRFRVRFTDIDVNRHVNAAMYVRWMLDSYASSFLEKNHLQSCEINFTGEAKQEDDVVIRQDAEGSSHSFAVERISDLRELCRAKLSWRCQATT